MASLATFQVENDIVDVDSTPQQGFDRDDLYKYDDVEQKAILAAHPWRTDPSYFRNVLVSSIALVKMAMHARSGGAIEVMGMMTGKILPNTFVVMDCYPLPVEGTETRVNAQQEGIEFMVEYLQGLKDVGRRENIVGWYHSHPGYGCWLSGIDVDTQFQNQQFQEPFLAVVVDPNRTISAGKVEIGAFRTYPKDYKPPKKATKQNQDQSVPLSKAKDYGAHSERYYELDVSFFKSSLDENLLQLLWNKNWAATLSQSTIQLNHDYTSKLMLDLSEKNAQLAIGLGEKTPQSQGRGFREAMSKADNEPHTNLLNYSTKGQWEPVNRSVKDGVQIGSDELQGLMSLEIQRRLFGRAK